ncbi:hypothetical protein CWC25_13160 [Pseudoalteromonas sp. S4389]|uniref:phage tail-collar fiber domain-containing protein n=1 Tax=Pseudoalteromonas sp. S4389 TaxID=579556 RepID=UPI0011085A42|nr:phage tail protein [Pseudoalteromonas sp. S4389]TMO43151.1 hypothetical protein CWC25_13160 [Pseudoalteromonas sp. S4389]
MSQLKITNAGIDYRNAVFAGEEVQNITHFIFANMPDQDATAPIDPNITIPTDVLHSQPIKAVSKVDGNAVVISAVLGYDVGDFEYNWYGVVATKQNGDEVLIAVVTTELQTKTKTVGAVTGNYSVKSIVWRSQNIADDLNITLAVLPWQVQDEELVSKAVFDAHNHDDSYLTKTDADNYAHKLKVNAFTKPITIGGEVLANSSAIFQVKGFMRVGTIFLSEGKEAEGNGVELSNSNGQLYWNNNKLIHHGNMGAGSGVDADKLDGKDATYFARSEDVKTAVPANALFTDTNTWRAVVDNLTSTAADKSLSANQGRIIKQMIDQVNALLTSDDTTLNEIQEVVNFIKQNRETLDSLGISNIAGLQNALDTKFNKSDATYYAHKSKANVFGSTQQIDTTGTALIIGGSGNQDDQDISVYFGNSINGGMGYNLTYKGTGLGNENAFELSSTNGAKPNLVFRALQDGTFDISQLNAKVAGNIIWHAGNMGAGSNLDADKLDGLQAEQFLRADRTDTMKGNLKVDVNASYDDLASNAPSNVGQFKIESGNNAVSFGLDEVTNSRKAWIQVGHNSNAYPSGHVQGKLALNPMGGDVEINGSKAWHAGNMGAGSGLDADKLDGLQASQLARTDAETVFKKPIVLGEKILQGSTASIQVKGFMRVGSIFLSEGLTAEGSGVELSNENGQLKWNGVKILHAGNMGAGSGIDADKLDGHEGDYFAKASDLENLGESRKFSRSSTINIFRRHSLGAGNYIAPSLRSDGLALQDQDWFSIRAVGGEPAISIKNNLTTKFRRLADGAMDSQVTIIADDRNERVFVYNKTDNVWEF